MKTRYFPTQNISQFFQIHNLYLMWLYALRLFLHAKLISVCFIQNYYLQICVYLYLVPLLLNGIGNLLAYVAVFFVTSVCRLLSLRGWGDSAWDSKSLDCSRSQIRTLHVADFLLIRGLFLPFLVLLGRAVFCWSSLKCLRSSASPLWLIFWLIFFIHYARFWCHVCEVMQTLWSASPW